MVSEAQVDAIPAFETTLISTPMQNPTQASQDIPATLTIANALLLLNIGSKFDKTTTKSSAVDELNLDTNFIPHI